MSPREVELRQFARYIVNGLMATAVHFAVLYFNIEVAGVASAGLANLLAAVAGVSAAYLGNRFFVFAGNTQPVLPQAGKYMLLYAVIALIHGGVLWLWSDVGGLDYRAGFIVATTLQFALSYLGNKRIVFAQV
jgi:putative flippase GtrA